MTTAPQSNILSRLPRAVWSEALSYLPSDDLLALRVVSKRTKVCAEEVLITASNFAAEISGQENPASVSWKTKYRSLHDLQSMSREHHHLSSEAIDRIFSSPLSVGFISISTIEKIIITQCNRKEWTKVENLIQSILFKFLPEYSITKIRISIFDCDLCLSDRNHILELIDAAHPEFKAQRLIEAAKPIPQSKQTPPPPPVYRS